MKKKKIALVMALLLGAAVLRVWALSVPGSDDSAPPAPASETKQQLPESSYEIAPDDMLHVSVWSEPELTTSVPVRSDGKISLPLVNDVQAAGLTPMQLAASLTEKLRKFVDDPRVTVMVSRMSHPRIYVLGEVLRHGPLDLLPGMGLLQVLATSGLTPFANTKKIYILRSVDGAEQKLPVNYKRLLKGSVMSQNISLKPGDTVVVP
jgi:polysaccharide export outer membrane protein